MRYRGFEITSCPDSGVERYNSAESRDEICEGFFCEIYPAGDDPYANQLDTFCLAEGYEIPDTSDAALTAGIIKHVDENYYELLESKNEVKRKRVGLSIILDTIIKKFDRRKPFEGTHRTIVCST